MNTHFTEFQLRKRGWTDNNLHITNDLGVQTYRLGVLTWTVPIIDVLRLEKTVEFIKGLPGCSVKGEFDSLRH